MIKKSVVIHFPKDLVDKPLVYRLVKDFGLSFNILKAEINPEVNPKEEGLLVIELAGTDEDYKRGVAFLKKEGLSVQLLSQDISMDNAKCVDCSVCVPLCPTEALIKDPQTYRVEFIKEKCIACGICIKACPYGAMAISFE